jgi:hypothetical protein
MKRHFVKTGNFALLQEGMHMLEERGARESGGMVITGSPAVGKTTCLYHWASSTGAAFVTMQQGWTPGRLIGALADRLGVPPARHLDTVLGEHLAAQQKAVIVDEAGHGLAETAACLERLRGITDKSGTPFILVFMEHDLWRLRQHLQLTSRIFHAVDMTPATLEDVAMACAQLAEVDIAPDLVRRIHMESGGLMRKVLNAIAKVEIAAKGLQKPAVSAADLKSTRLVVDVLERMNPARHGNTNNPGKAKGVA